MSDNREKLWRDYKKGRDSRNDPENGTSRDVQDVREQIITSYAYLASSTWWTCLSFLASGAAAMTTSLGMRLSA